jgi:hypothetical protein
MQLVRLTRPQRARLRLQVQLRLPLTNKQHRRLPPVPPPHLHQLPHPVRARNQVQARNRVQVQNRARSRLQAPTPPRHRPVNKMNFRLMKSNLVGRGSLGIENCFRSSGPFHAPGSVRPKDVPSRGSEVWQASGRDSNLEMVLQLSSRQPRLGNPVSLTHHEAGINDGPCDYQMAVREPRPTKAAVTNHLLLFTSHLSHQGYVCS